ncbi:hypothetical protein [Absidia glauca]|uniref:Uncharacterized protein n=1 Tax=Absidia glauca TaxID=4829 RepID=A0A168M228_ABSGL|nr:hypothetical protein [Absidia glauca]
MLKQAAPPKQSTPPTIFMILMILELSCNTREGSVFSVGSAITVEGNPVFEAPPVPNRRRSVARPTPVIPRERVIPDVVASSSALAPRERVIPDVVASSSVPKNKRKAATPGSQTKRKANNP